MTTQFGILCKKLRSERGKLLFNQALEFSCSSAFISAVENGKKPIPEKFIERFSIWLELGPNAEKQLMRAAAIETRKISISSSDTGKRQLAIEFGRALESLSEEQVAAIRNSLNREIKNVA